MLVRSIISLATSFFVLAVATGSSTAWAQQPDCRFFKVEAAALNVFKEPRGASEFIARLDKNDIVCVGRDQETGGFVWAYIIYKLEKANRRNMMGGWGIMRSLQPATPDEVAAVRGPPEPAPAPTAEVPAPNDDVVQFSKPITFGPVPVNGHSLEDLIAGVPLFSPIEGLPESEWKKTCNSCHQWDRKTLCAQAAVYAKNPKAELRIPHPYGGAEKIAMVKWFQGGCQ